MSSIIVVLHALPKSLPLHCCSRWYRQHPSRNAEWITERRVTSLHELVHGLRKQQQPQSGNQSSAYHQLLSVHSEISLRHCSKLRQMGRKTLHRWSRRVQRKYVCKYDRILTTIKLHITRWLGLSESCCKFLLALFYFLMFLLTNSHGTYYLLRRLLWIQQHATTRVDNERYIGCLWLLKVCSQQMNWTELNSGSERMYSINQSIITARCYAPAVLAMGLCLSVSLCPSVSVCLSQVGVLLKRLNVGSHKQHHTIDQGL